MSKAYTICVFHLIVDVLMDIHVVNGQLSKRVSTDQCDPTVSRVQVELIKVTCFLSYPLTSCWF